MTPRRKTQHHLRFVNACVAGRKALSAASKLVETRRYEDGSHLSEDELRLKCASAMSWITKAEEELTTARVQLAKELEHRTVEADPETIRRHQLEADFERLRRNPRRNWEDDQLRDEVLKLRRDIGMVPAAIADTLKVSEFRVKQILREAA